MTLSKAKALALAEFAGIEVVDPKGIPYAKHNEPELMMGLSRYLRTAEGALRVLAAMGKISNKEWWSLIPENDESFVIVLYGYRDGLIITLKQVPFEKRCDAQTAILTAALQLPEVQELVKKYQGENNE